MIRSALAALAVIIVCVGIMQIPGQPDTLPLPSANATPPTPTPLTICPMPDSDELWTAIHILEDRVAELEKRPLCPPVSIVEPEAVEAPAPEAVTSDNVAVTMHTTTGCAECVLFIRNELPQLADLNVRIVEGGAMSYPTFVLVSDRKTITLGGRMTAAGLRYRIRELLSR